MILVTMLNILNIIATVMVANIVFSDGKPCSVPFREGATIYNMRFNIRALPGTLIRDGIAVKTTCDGPTSALVGEPISFCRNGTFRPSVGSCVAPRKSLLIHNTFTI